MLGLIQKLKTIMTKYGVLLMNVVYTILGLGYVTSFLSHMMRGKTAYVFKHNRKSIKLNHVKPKQKTPSILWRLASYLLIQICCGIFISLKKKKERRERKNYEIN